MAAINKTALVPYSPEAMFKLVDDIESYPEFLPWCSHTEVLARGDAEVKASIGLAVKGIKNAFTTHNTFKRNHWIKMQLLKGPFKQLQGQWHFQALGEDGCKVSLEMNFEFSSRLLEISLGPVFTHIMNSLVDAFIQRAGELYGKPG